MSTGPRLVNPGLPGFRSLVRKSGRPDLRARSKNTGERIQMISMPRLHRGPRGAAHAGLVKQTAGEDDAAKAAPA
jgi:hypothetical protein